MALGRWPGELASALLLALPLHALAIAPAGGSDELRLGGTADAPGVHSKDGAITLHESDGPLPR